MLKVRDMATKIDPEMLERARIMRDEGKSLKTIGKALGRSQATISRWLMKPDALDLPGALDIGATRDEARKQVIAKLYKVIFMNLDRVEKDIKRGSYSPKHPPAVTLGILMDKLVAIEAAAHNVPPLPGGSSVNIFAEINQLSTVIEKVAHAGQPAPPPSPCGGGDTSETQSLVRQDHSDESLYPPGPQAPPEAGGIPPGDRPADG